MERDLVLPDAPGGRDALTPLDGARIHGFAGEAMGTDFSVSVALVDDSLMPRLERRFERVLASVIAQVSQWQPGSRINAYNAAPAGAWVAIGPQFAQVMECALALAQASDGAFDPALGEASEAWGFGTASAPEALPGPVPCAHAWRGIALDADAGALLQPGGARLDLSGIAKGFAVDMALAALRREGARHLIVEIGGELKAAGVRPDGEPWWVDCEPVPGSAEPPPRIALTGWAVATSGDWQRRREAAGESWSHTLSPETGRPVAGLRAATVLHRGCMQADAIATALMVMGEEAGLAFADRHGIAARMTNARGVAVDSGLWRRWCR